MIPQSQTLTLKGWSILACSVLLTLAVVWCHGYWTRGRQIATMAQQTIIQSRGEADVFKGQAEATRAKIASDDPGLAIARADVARKTAELNHIRAAVDLPATDANVLPGQHVDARVDNLAAVVAGQDEVIKAQKDLIGKQDTKIADLANLADLERRRSEALEREVGSLRVVLASQPSRRSWSAGVRVERCFDGRLHIGVVARRDIGPGYAEVSGHIDRAGIGFGWRW